MVKRCSRLQEIRLLGPFLPLIKPNNLTFMREWFKSEKPHIHDGKIRVNTFFPPYPSTAHERFVKAVFSGKRIPHSVYVASTYRCPCSCPHCSYGRRPEEEFSTEEFRDLIDQIKELGSSTIGFTGGEPLLRKDLEELVEYSGPELNTIIFTTGHGLTKKRAASLSKAGVGCVTVGIESADPRKHDSVRGVQGSFDWCGKSVRSCIDAGIYTAISTIGLKDRIRSGEIQRIYDTGRSWDVGEMRLLTPVPTGSYTGRIDEFPDPEDLEYLKEFHRTRNREKEGPAVLSFAYLESPDLFGCGAGFHHLFIDASGNVCPCDLTPLSFGNVKDDDLKSIWDGMGEFFSRPRNSCLMREAAPMIRGEDDLPLPPGRSGDMIPEIAPGESLPKWYHLLEG
ncbi:MAG: radical SAM protein [Thermoplasmatota archaeon]